VARHFTFVAALWAVFPPIGYVLVLNFTPFPVAAAKEAKAIDGAFTLLTLLSVPVFAFVCAVLAYSLVRWHLKGDPDSDGPALRGHKPPIVTWFTVTSAPTIAVIIHPGITGLREVRAHDNMPVDLLVQVEGRRFFWNVIYPEQGVKSRKELVLPIGVVTRFEVTAYDVLHSFWIPAFRIKVDAVPGMYTAIVATPDEFGTFAQDPNFRLQCAELCGAGHATMRLPVRVVSQEEFDTWIAEQSPAKLTR